MAKVKAKLKATAKAKAMVLAKAKAMAKVGSDQQWEQLQPQMCAVGTQDAVLRSSASIVTGDRGATHALTGRAQALPAATATATGLLTKVGSDLDAACGEVGAAVASDVPGEYTRSAPPFVRFHIT